MLRAGCRPGRRLRGAAGEHNAADSARSSAPGDSRRQLRIDDALSSVYRSPSEWRAAEGDREAFVPKIDPWIGRTVTIVAVTAARFGWRNIDAFRVEAGR